MNWFFNHHPPIMDEWTFSGSDTDVNLVVVRHYVENQEVSPSFKWICFQNQKWFFRNQLRNISSQICFQNQKWFFHDQFRNLKYFFNFHNPIICHPALQKWAEVGKPFFTDEWIQQTATDHGVKAIICGPVRVWQREKKVDGCEKICLWAAKGKAEDACKQVANDNHFCRQH